MVRHISLPVFLLSLPLLCAPAMASDVELPPELRPSTFDIYVGAFGSANMASSSFIEESGLIEGDLDGTAYGAGLRGGVDYVADGWVFGVVGDWTYGGDLAETNDNLVRLNMDSLFTLRARAGGTVGNALLYVTGGFAQAGLEMTADLGDSVNADTVWANGWTVGAGVDYSLTESVSMNLEYLFINLEDPTFEVTDSDDIEYSYKQDMNGIHSIRLGVNYAFHI